MLVFFLYFQIARSCIENGTDMVTASYLTPGMKALARAAEEAGITVVNEVRVLWKNKD
jgi:alpha-aminoadipic semialdehyde synthase